MALSLERRRLIRMDAAMRVVAENWRDMSSAQLRVAARSVVMTHAWLALSVEIDGVPLRRHPYRQMIEAVEDLARDMSVQLGSR
jgi:hypothetical protein